ncbi:hypothetical protein PR001_g6152 [Phytophthora rubi]|nr:hypothetical protein PR001_g6152 [Phytophthora rubi]
MIAACFLTLWRMLKLYSETPEQSNEPYAWESREHLRKLCVGKQVRYYKAEYYKAEINRDLWSVWLLPNARGVEKT